MKTSEANAIKGENEAKISIANSDALRRGKRGRIEPHRYHRQKCSRQGRWRKLTLRSKKPSLPARNQRSTQIANIVIPAEIAKQRAITSEAQAEAERIRNAKAEADAIYAKMEAEAKGLYEILTKQAEGYKGSSGRCGWRPDQSFPTAAHRKRPELVKTQEAGMKNIKIDKITV